MISERTSSRIPSTLRWGVLLALGTAVISGFSIFVNGFAVKQLPDPAVYTTLKNGIAAILLVILAVATVRPVEIRAISRRSWGWLAVIGIVGGSIPFVLFFTGLAQASAPSAAFIQKTLFIWVALLAVPLLGERLGLAQLGALAVLLVGQALILTPAGVTWGSGETMIAAATLLWAVETIVARRVLRTVPAAVVGAARLSIGMVVLVGYLAITGKLGAVIALTGEQWRWVLLTGLLLFGYVGTWFAALKRAPASLVTAILVVGAPVTAALQVVATGKIPPMPVLSGELLVLAVAVALVAPTLRRWRLASEPVTELAALMLAGWDRPIAPAPGPIRFARYAFGPNRLGYCGPEEAGELFEQATVGKDIQRLRDLAVQFEGAYPYLRLIAREQRHRGSALRGRRPGVLARRRAARQGRARSARPLAGAAVPAAAAPRRLALARRQARGGRRPEPRVPRPRRRSRGWASCAPARPTTRSRSWTRAGSAGAASSSGTAIRSSCPRCRSRWPRAASSSAPPASSASEAGSTGPGSSRT